MKKAAGVSDIEEVVRRFETQEETAKHLQELQVQQQKQKQNFKWLNQNHRKPHKANLESVNFTLLHLT
jgi:C4-type Zn-finger protein